MGGLVFVNPDPAILELSTRVGNVTAVCLGVMAVVIGLYLAKLHFWPAPDANS